MDWEWAVDWCPDPRKGIRTSYGRARTRSDAELYARRMARRAPRVVHVDGIPMICPRPRIHVQRVVHSMEV